VPDPTASRSAVDDDRPGQDGAAPSDRILTIPNALSLLRLLGVPVFLYLVLSDHRDGWAFLLLVVSGATDYLDGKLARALGQTSRLGTLLDPAADRLYVLSTILGLTIRGIVPVWFAVVLIGRDVALFGFVPILSRLGYRALPVHYLGKAATFNLLYAFPMLLLSAGHGELATVCRPMGWAFALWGTALYWWALVLYVVQVRQLLRAHREAQGQGQEGLLA
jgi:CDP-diacylglycerol--glycerol-3-phosphate 3-phosphatidyltransferase